MKKINMAVLITCHNRIQKTQTCLKSLFNQKKIENINLKVFLVDDGSKDGTKEYVKNYFPQVNLIIGSGNLYWGGGMFLAWETALRDNIEYGYFLWINDDTFLYDEAIYTLLETQTEHSNIICGSICDPITKKRTYGGAINEKKIFRPFYYKVVDVNGSPQEIDTINGNAVLIPYKAYDKIGKFDKKLFHAGGDLDYSLRARKKNIRVLLTPTHIGTCERSGINNEIKSLKDIFNVKLLPPKVWFRICLKHGDSLWLFHFFYRYFSLFFKILINNLVTKKR
ncbi:glycosyltransferase family 2 protein [Candidatus Pelagibacter sp. Uisw_137]|uniref:glycosyltransferase family 2 protein n=1 Tax=Candidatus Pelagibacter sp. Uisw_137 TaxID=3230992 RepID=UPI0039E93FFE